MPVVCVRNLQFVDRSGTVFAELSAQHKKNTECVLDGSTTVQMKFHTDTCAVLEHHLKQLQVWVGEIVRIVKSIPDADHKLRRIQNLAHSVPANPHVKSADYNPATS